MLTQSEYQDTQSIDKANPDLNHEQPLTYLLGIILTCVTIPPMWPKPRYR